MSINIHGKEYITVAERVKAAGEDLRCLNTEVLSHSPVVIKATVTTIRGSFTGISAANPDKSIEKMSPYEVAETSAVGRALGFAGYGLVEGVATADEMVKAENIPSPNKTSAKNIDPEDDSIPSVCPKCGGRLVEKLKKNGKPYLKCENGGWDKDARKATGCDYVNWKNPKGPMSVEEFDADNNYEGKW
jgi:predicted RNA-binding Zn-ribbon protein involved in translation (DUF1610 family)